MASEGAFLRCLGAGISVLIVVGCAQVQSEQAASTMDMLGQAGFRTAVATGPQQQAQLAAQPQMTLVRHTTAAGARFVYADDAGCRCLAVGDQPAYERYRKLLVAQDKQMIDEANATENTLNWGDWFPEAADW